MACTQTLTGHTDAVRALTVVGDYLFSGSYDQTVRAWQLPTAGSSTALVCAAVLHKHRGPVRALANVGSAVFSGSYDNTVCCWDANVRSSLHMLTIEHAPVYKVFWPHIMRLVAK